MAEELETVLRLVAEGRLTPDEAAPIIEALTRAEQADEFAQGFGDDFGDVGDFDELDRLGDRIERGIGRSLHRAGRSLNRAARAARVARAAQAARTGGGRQLRIKVTENGRQVVNLRIPIAFVDTALQFVPGLGGDQSQRIRNAVRAGAVGPILDVEDPDGGSGVLISVE